MKIVITEEIRGEVERIQRRFAKQLSTDEILRGTAQAINGVLTRSTARVNKQVKQEYNITPKYLSRTSRVYPKANSGHLWGGVELNTGRLPLIAFKPKQVGSSIAVAIHKGKTQYIRNSFIATMASGHTGVYSRGRYVKKEGFVPGREKTASGKVRITQIHGATVFQMGTYQSVADDVRNFMGNELSARVEGILKSKVNKIAKG